MDYKVIDEEAWAAVAPPGQPDVWDDILTLLAQGRCVRVAYTDEHERRVAMVNLQRRATRQGLTLERRVSAGALYYRARPQGGRPAWAKEKAR